MTDQEFLTKLIDKTKKAVYLWTPVETQSFECHFGEEPKKKIIFSFDFTNDAASEEEQPDVFILAFISELGGHYKQMVAYDYDITNNPLVPLFKELYGIIMININTIFERDCSLFFQ